MNGWWLLMAVGWVALACAAVILADRLEAEQ